MNDAAKTPAALDLAAFFRASTSAASLLEKTAELAPYHCSEIEVALASVFVELDLAEWDDEDLNLTPAGVALAAAL